MLITIQPKITQLCIYNVCLRFFSVYIILSVVKSGLCFIKMATIVYMVSLC